MFAVQQVLTGAAGSVRRDVRFPGLVAAGWEAGSLQILAANPGDQTVTTLLANQAVARTLGADAAWAPASPGPLTLGPYRTALIDYPLSRDL